MRRRLVLRLAAVLLASSCLAGGAVPSDTRVLLDHGRVSIRCDSAPLADILSRFAQATGAQVVYEAARPRQLVSVVIEAGSGAEAIAQLLEGQGLNYALRLDPTGRNVEMLVITGSGSGPAASTVATRAARQGPPAAPAPEEPYEVPAGDVDQPFSPEGVQSPDSSVPSGTFPDDAMNPALGSPRPGAAPGAPSAGEPTSAEAPPGSAVREPGQPQPPSPASYPGSVPAPPPVYPAPASYPGER